MAEVTKVYRSAAFEPVAREIKRFGALHKSEAYELFDSALLSGAARRRVYAERATEIGSVLYLLHQGRRLVGMAGGFNYTDDALMNAVCLRSVGVKLEDRGMAIDTTTRQRSLVYNQAGQDVLVLARHNGYSFASLRRLYKELIEGGKYSEIHMYSYLATEKLEELSQTLYEPARGSQPLDKEKLRLFTLPLPGTAEGN